MSITTKFSVGMCTRAHTIEHDRKFLKQEFLSKHLK